MKVFISQPMKGKTKEEIFKERDKAVESIKAKVSEPIEIIDNFLDDAPKDANALWYLGESIKRLSTAELAYFCKGFEEARGCKIEYECALAYQIETVILSYED